MLSNEYLTKYLEEAKCQAALEVWNAYRDGRTWGPKDPETTVADIVGRIAKWGDASPKALNYLQALLERIAERNVETLPVPGGRCDFTGVVLTVKEVEGRFGVQTKVLLKTAGGWKVYGTLPQSCRRAAKGDRISMAATVIPSDNDKSFGFFSRPARAFIVDNNEVGEFSASTEDVPF